MIRDGDKAQEILNLIDEDVDIAILVLGAGIDIEGPDPLASNIGKTAGGLPNPGRHRAWTLERRGTRRVVVIARG